MIKFICDILLTIYQCIIPVYMIKKQIIYRKHSILYEFSTIASMVIYLLIIQYVAIPLPDTLVFIIPLLFIYLITDEHFTKCFFWIVLDTFLYMGTLSLISNLFDVSIAINGISSADNITLFQYNLIGNSALAIMAILVTKCITNQFSISPQMTLLLIITLIINFVINECFFSLRKSSVEDTVLLLGSTCTFLSLISIILLYECLTEISRKKQFAEMNLRTTSIILEHQDELKTIYTKMLAEQHDLKHRIAVAEEIISTGKINEFKENELLEFLHYETSPLTFFTGNTAIDALLKAKSAIMNNANIRFEYIEYPLNELPIDEPTFCMLLGNLLDNAIEGVMRLPASESNRNIQLRISKVWEMFFINCTNSANINTIKKNGDLFISSKPNPEYHGFGTENMKQIVDAAGGSIDFIINENQFTVEIMLGGEYTC